MTEDSQAIERPTPRAPDANAAPRVRTLLACDLVDSTALVERLGDAVAADLLRRHDRIARDLIHRHGGREIDKTDGYLVLFERPVEAVAFALHYQRALREFDEGQGQPLRTRVGIHVGEVVLWENNPSDVAAGAKPIDIEGLAKPVVARLMTLAMPGQILLSGVAFTLAQRAEKELVGGANLRWLTHGRYHFKGVPAPMLVHEVGESGHAPLQAPSSSSKAIRDVPIWRRPGVIALEAVAVIAAIAIPFALSLRSAPAIAFAERDWVVVGEMRNLTGETLLDDSLETAFRISLEQSRFVNVLPDLKLRAALARMQKPPETAVDRLVGSEIALREGARAVILPTVAEIGGRIRVSAEIVDPNTQTTVYAESADGVGAESALDSIDSVTYELRERLGEALASIEQDSAPLPQVTSANLDALRAYALGYRAYLRADDREALSLYRQALSLDPEFSQAHIGIARVHLAGENDAEARLNMEAALRHRERLPARELLYAEAFEALLNYREDYLERWRNLIAVYPDFYSSYYNYALYSYVRGNDFESAIEVAEDGLDKPFFSYGQAHYLLALLELGEERYDPAQEHLEKAKALEADGTGLVWAQLAGARRDFAAAEAAISGFKPSGLPSNDVFVHLMGAAIDADQGDFTSALRRLAQGREEAGTIGPFYVRVFDGAALALREAIEPPAELRPAIASFVEAEMKGVREDDPAQRPHAIFALAWASAAATRAGDDELSARALDAAQSASNEVHHPQIRQMILVARATRDPASVRSSELDRYGATGLLAVRALKIESKARASDLAKAQALSADLAKARGRAYAEVGSHQMLLARNLVDVNLAYLRAAELAASAGKRDLAQQQLTQFLALWTKQPLPDTIQRRVEALDRRLKDSSPRSG